MMIAAFQIIDSNDLQRMEPERRGQIEPGSA